MLQVEFYGHAKRWLRLRKLSSRLSQNQLDHFLNEVARALLRNEIRPADAASLQMYATGAKLRIG